MVVGCLAAPVLSFAPHSALVVGLRSSSAGAACVSRPGLRAAAAQRNRAGAPALIHWCATWMERLRTGLRWAPIYPDLK